MMNKKIEPYLSSGYLMLIQMQAPSVISIAQPLVGFLHLVTAQISRKELDNAGFCVRFAAAWVLKQTAPLKSKCSLAFDAAKPK